MVAVPPKLLGQMRLRTGSRVDNAVERRRLTLRPVRGARPPLGRTLRRRDVSQEPAATSVEENLAAEVDFSEASNAGVPDVGTHERAEAWRAENRDALDSSNAYVAMYGLPLAKHQKF